MTTHSDRLGLEAESGSASVSAAVAEKNVIIASKIARKKKGDVASTLVKTAGSKYERREP